MMECVSNFAKVVVVLWLGVMVAYLVVALTGEMIREVRYALRK